AASAGSQNATMRAIAEGLPAEVRPVSAEVPFSSARKWSGVTIEGVGSLVMGAPDVLIAAGVSVDAGLAETAGTEAATGRRVVLLAHSDAPLAGEALPAGLVAAGAAVLVEGLRPDAGDTVAFMHAQGVDLKVISGDGVGTVRAVALAAGVPGAERAIAGADLPADPAELERVALGTVVFGRVTPEDKRDILAALDRRGRYTAMVGDGVNDVLALKEARLAIAMGNGSQMAKGVGDLVLVSNDFATVPRAVEEGRRIIRNTHRVAKLFVAKSVYAAALLATFGMSTIAFPFLPRHLTVTSSLTIGIPAFFLALAASDGRVRREGFLRSLGAFVVPAGLVSAGGIAASYLLARRVADLSLEQGRAAAVITATLIGLAILVQVERGPERRPVRRWVWGMVAAFQVANPHGLSIPFLRDFCAIPAPGAAGWAVIAAGSAAGAGLLWLMRRIPWLVRLEDPEATRERARR
ncbi:MAG: HAD-IC family P-type ATPase, partial [Miltoncostaeaceae bacterium]